MLFNSIPFLIFFPIVALLYFITPVRLKTFCLLVASYFFYACWHPVHLLLLLALTLLTYFGAFALQHFVRCRKMIFIVFLLACFVPLFFYKYAIFVLSGFTPLLALASITIDSSALSFFLPLGISFYTFTAAGYLIDVYRHKTAPVRNFIDYALFVSFFGTLVSGPIQRADVFLPQLRNLPKFDCNRVKDGLLLIAWGLFQKLVIADRLAIFVNEVYDHYYFYAGFTIAIATIFYAFQIYCDFAGYSDVAIGVAQVLGIQLSINFRAPYFSFSVQEFWRRWHISLSTWFRDYIYFPLGGSRCSIPCKYRNLMITFLVSGLWHGAGLTYLVWGALNGFYQVVEDFLKRKNWMKPPVTRKQKAGAALFTFLLIDFSWLFFRAPSLQDAFSILKTMFSRFNPWVFFDGSLYRMGLNRTNFLLAVFLIIGLLVIDYLRQRMNLRAKLAAQKIGLRWFVYYAAIFSIIIFGIYGSAFDASQFIYGNF
ncbi:MAG: MBOAT family O-acyltransferase [Ruthenibacterium sp.]